MKKFYQKFLTVLLLIVLVCTSCRSVTINSKPDSNDSEITTSDKDNETDANDSEEATAEQKKFDTFTSDLFKEIVSESSLSVHSYFSYPEDYGFKNCPYTLGDASKESFDEDNEKVQKYLDELVDFNYDYLTDNQKLTYDILKTDLEDSLNFSDFYLYEDYLSPMSGIQTSLPSFLGEFEFNAKSDVKDYIELIKLIPDYYDSVMSYESEKAEKGMGIPDFWIDSLIDSCNEFISNTDNHFLITTFNDKINKLSDIESSEKDSYIKENTDIVKNSILPAYQKMISSLSSLKGKCKNEGGLCNYENGKKYYELLVRDITSSDKTVSEIKNMLNKKLKKDLNSIMVLSYKDADLYDKMDKYSFDTSDPDTILKHLLGEITADFPEGYDTNYTVSDVPKDIEKYENPAYYYIPHIDNTSKNNIYINRNETYKDMDLYPVLAHEGFPGHMYQTTYFQNTNPDLIRNLLRYTGYIEGWGLYAELYSYNYSGQDKDTIKFNKAMQCLSYDVYCLADIGIHYDGWSRQETKDFITSVGYDESVGDDIFETLVEDPAVYLAYYIGYLEFTDMKEAAETELGDNFDAKSFHKFILDIGPAQFEIIKDRFDTWLSQQKTTA